MSDHKKFCAGTLGRDLAKAWTDNKKWTDLLVRSTPAGRAEGKTKDGKNAQTLVLREIPCHKFVLVSKSPVFGEMLSKEPQAAYLDVDLSPATLSSLIDFFYTDQVSEDQIDHNLLVAAEKFEVFDLKAKCANAMARKVDLNNAVKFFLAAIRTHSEELKQTTMNFIVDNLNEMMNMNDWNVMDGKKSFVEIFMDSYLMSRAESSTVTVQSRQ